MDEDEVQKAYTNVTVRLRATDIDRNKQGWAGQVEHIYEDRLKMQVYPTVNLKLLHGKKTVIGDIILVSRKQDSGEYKPYMFHLVSLHDEVSRSKKSKSKKSA